MGFSTLVSTVIFAAYALGVIVALALFGRISDVIGRRRTLFPGLLCAMVSAGVFLIADDVVLLVVARILSGVSAGLITGTATATLVDLAGTEGQGRATLLATLASIGGLGLGPLVAGGIAEVAAAPLLLPYFAHLALLLVVFAATWLYLPETVAPSGPCRPPLPRLRVPSRMAGTFLRSAIPGFVGFSVLGLFSAVAPAFLVGLLGRRAPALVGVVVAVVFLASAAGQALRSDRGNALAAGSALLVLGWSGLAAALATSSLLLLVAAGAIAGVGHGLSFRAGLALLNAEAPADSRAEVASAFFVVMYLAISVPVVGVGFAAGSLGLRAAGLMFCIAMALVALVAYAVQYLPGRTQRAASESVRQPVHPASVGDCV